jgi:hypothetical protein
MNHGFGQNGVRWFVGEVFLAGKEAQKGAALLRRMIPDGPAQDRVLCLQSIEHGRQRRRGCHVEQHLIFYLRQCAQVLREYDTDHAHAA